VIVQTARLDLVPLSLPMLEALVDGDQLRADPAEEPWLYRVAVLRSTGHVVARGGFHAPPDGDGTVEIGYSVAPAHRREGLATELATGLLDWARTQGAARCLASVSPGNTASLAIMAWLGFVRTGDQIDERDGLELVHTLEWT
jgi:RimJ/RimL family protein N-acetyltransferase